MSRTVELWLFWNENGLYPGKFFGDDWIYIEWQFVNDGEYCKLSFSWDMWTTIKSSSWTSFIKWSSDLRDLNTEIISEKMCKAYLYKKWLLNWNWVFSRDNDEVKISEEWNYVDWRLTWAWKRVTIYVWEGKVIEEWNFFNWELNWYWKSTSIFWDHKEIYVWELKNWNPEWKWVLKDIDKSWFNCSRKYEWNFVHWLLNWYWKITDLDDKFVYTWYVKNWYPEWKWRIDYPDWDSISWMFENWVLKYEDGLFKHNFRGEIWWPVWELQVYFNA